VSGSTQTCSVKIDEILATRRPTRPDSGSPLRLESGLRARRQRLDDARAGGTGRTVDHHCPRDGSGASLSLPGAGLKFQAVVWLLPHGAATDPNVTGRWEYHYAVNPATGTTWCAS
jgi:hypothetical protein